MGADSVWFGDGQQGFPETRKQGNKGIAGLPPEVVGPRGRYLTGLVEPCGPQAAGPSRVPVYLFIHLLRALSWWKHFCHCAD
jgi:hypothetical protein